jgi:arsenate reductase-like glutaredoxin family protein
VNTHERDFFKNPFSRAEIEELLQGRPASEMFNFRSPSFRKTGLKKEELGGDQLIEMMLEEPRLVRRPVVRVDGKVHFGADMSILATLIG